MGRSSSQALLDLETTTHTSSSKESALLLCKPDADDGDLLLKKKFEAAKSKANALPVTKPAITAPPPSLVMGKLKDFLGVMAESNKKLQQEAMNSKNPDIEALTGDESEYIEMDLMLGVADLNTPEAVAAAESAIVGSQPIISLDASSSDSESEDSSDDDSCNDETNKASDSRMKSNGQTLGGKSTNAISENGQKRKRSKIVELP
ncbi:hypothetical protein HanRHA438_Chr11g0521381 [Helianthus annuus]|nr:hypothetical protein HanHA300_Chr11g0417451 [Helianthus annuus]KAJ0686818.1 hypothetical protein HanLR1_Chr11g0419021 [Helianthus annuus]KAJ0690625.1 hypothetical protein HanOQP8_Chr11g0419941 [Helianthus annuus]KAJ0872228.1 hypothetical protein HanRHA438_Chr11g0521381 [Helianthus annuus]KAJ0876601.1 hypothetical protein HanPSC8_Chr11g0490301 [Helianthus annuus]